MGGEDLMPHHGQKYRILAQAQEALGWSYETLSAFGQANIRCALPYS